MVSPVLARHTQKGFFLKTMCAPVIGLAFGVLSSVASFAAQSQQAAAQESQYQQNAVNAKMAMINEYQQENLRQIQEGQKKSAEDVQTNLKAAQAKAHTQAAAAEAGVTGISVDNLVADIGKQASDEMSAREYNYLSTVTQIQRQKEASRNQAQSRINSVPHGIQPSPLALVAGIGTAFAKSYGGKLAES